MGNLSHTGPKMLVRLADGTVYLSPGSEYGELGKQA